MSPIKKKRKKNTIEMISNPSFSVFLIWLATHFRESHWDKHLSLWVWYLLKTSKHSKKFNKKTFLLFSFSSRVFHASAWFSHLFSSPLWTLSKRYVPNTFQPYLLLDGIFNHFPFVVSAVAIIWTFQTKNDNPPPPP